MPYIDETERAKYDKHIRAIADQRPTSGELNYVLSKLLSLLHPSCYSEINDMVGVLECCKLEFYRRVAAPYEDLAKKRNGDIQ